VIVKLTLAVLALAFALIPAVVRAAELSVTPTTLLRTSPCASIRPRVGENRVRFGFCMERK
jgi:hypothetical protein